MPEIQVSDHVDVEALRTRLRKMTDAELQRFGRNNRHMCSPYATVRDSAARGQGGMEKKVFEDY